MEKIVYLVGEEAHKKRIDQALSLHCKEYSRNFFQQLIRSNSVCLNGAPLKKSSISVKTGDYIEVTLRPCKALVNSGLALEDMKVSLLFEHPDFLIVYKPAGLIVHAPSTHSQVVTLVDWLIHSFNELAFVGEQDRPGIVHRLDKDTSGILIVPKNNRAHAQFSLLFQKRLIEKTYLAVVEGHPPLHGTIDYAIGRDRKHKHKMSANVPQGREATTSYKVLDYFTDSALVEVHPITGRTHQIRVHCAAIGHPVIGDRIYGSSHPLIQRQALHAFQLSFMYYNRFYSFWHTLPSDIQTLITML